MTFRSDINGLRAVAVIAVLLYHFGVAGFGGGFVGVDVFYVISGFLMTQIICTKLAHQRFSLMGFYAARARRILPALFVVVAVLLMGGIFYLTPQDYKVFGWQALSALLFTSNIVFSHSGDYFDSFAQQKWLLHTWSLSVEWQFYLLLPLLLMTLNKAGGLKNLRNGVTSVFLLSFVTSLIMTYLQPVAAFYLLPPRAWEMLAGSLVFFYAARFSEKRGLTEAGLLFILASALCYTNELDFPGIWAALPVAGAALVILGGRKNVLLDNPAAQFFGTISYSLYLWHWPVLVTAKYFEMDLDGLTILFLIVITILLSLMSHRLIEVPFRQARRGGFYQLCSYGAAAICAYLVFSAEGFPARVADDVRAAAVVAEAGALAPKHGKCGGDYKKKAVPPECFLGADVSPTAVVWGDSHAGALSLALGEALKDSGRSAFFYSYAGCPPVLGAVMSTKWKKHQCGRVNQATFDKTAADKRVRDVFLISRWSLYLEGYNEKGGLQPYVVFGDTTSATKKNYNLRAAQYAEKIVATACALTAAHKKVYLVAPVPEMGKYVPSALAKSRLLWQRDEKVGVTQGRYALRNKVVLQALADAVQKCRAHIVDPASVLCKAGNCAGTQDGKSLYTDDNHLSSLGNKLVKPLFAKELRH